MNKWLILAVLGAQLMAMTGCASLYRPKYPEKPSDEQTQQTPVVVAPVPEKAAPKPVPVPVVPAARQLPRFDVTANDTPAREFFMGLVSGTSVNMVVHPEVAGNVTIRLRHVTLEDTLRAVRDSYGYDFLQKPYGYQILPRTLQSRVFRINYLNINRQGMSSTSVSSGEISETGSESNSSREGGVLADSSSSSTQTTTLKSSRIQTESRTDFWQQLHNALTTLVGSEGGRSVVVDPVSGIAVVKALPSELRDVEAFLDHAQRSLRQQVLIEAKILEVQLSEGYANGISWDTFGALAGGANNRVAAGLDQADFSSLLDENVALIGGVFTLDARFTDFDAVLKLLRLQGDVQVLSSPRISTLNNQKAVIKVGSDEFFVTDVSSTTTTTSSTVSDTPDVTLTPFFSGIALDVTPQISENADVVLHVHPSITEVVEKVKDIGLGEDETLSLPLAYSTKRETDSVIRASSGQVVVIGGLMQDSYREEISSIPLLGDIPWIGELLFSQHLQRKMKSELVILLKPYVIEDANWAPHTAGIEERFQPYFGDFKRSPIEQRDDKGGETGSTQSTDNAVIVTPSSGGE